MDRAPKAVHGNRTPSFSVFMRFSSLHREERFLLANINTFMLGTYLSNVFVSLFLWETTSSFRVLAYFQLMSAVLIAAAFVLFGFAATRIYPETVYRIGILAFIAFYLLLLLLGEQAGRYVLLLGSLNGVAAGLFYTGNNILTYDVVQGINRISFMTLNNLLTTISSVIGPAMAGMVFFLVRGKMGFYTLFTLSVAVIAASYVTSYGIRGWSRMENFRFSRTLSVFITNRHYRLLTLNDVISGFSSTVTAISLVALVYLASRSAPYVAEFAVITAIVQVLSSVALRTGERKRLPSLAGIGGVVLVAGSIFLFPPIAFWKVIIYGISSGISSTLINVPYMTSALDAIDTDEDGRKNRIYYIINREYVLLVARASAALAFLLVYAASPSLSTVAALIAGSSGLNICIFGTLRLFYSRWEGRQPSALADGNRAG